MGLGTWHVDVRMLAKLVGDPGGGGLHGADDDEFRKARSSHVFPFTRLFRRDGISGGEDRSPDARSEEHTSELQSLMRLSYAVFCLKKKTIPINIEQHNIT